MILSDIFSRWKCHQARSTFDSHRTIIATHVEFGTFSLPAWKCQYKEMLNAFIFHDITFKRRMTTNYHLNYNNNNIKDCLEYNSQAEGCRFFFLKFGGKRGKGIMHINALIH